MQVKLSCLTRNANNILPCWRHEWDPLQLLYLRRGRRCISLFPWQLGDQKVRGGLGNRKWTECTIFSKRRRNFFQNQRRGVAVSWGRRRRRAKGGSEEEGAAGQNFPGEEYKCLVSWEMQRRWLFWFSCRHVLLSTATPSWCTYSLSSHTSSFSSSVSL